MLATIFTLQLSVPVQPRLVTVGRYDGRHPCLTCATAGGALFIVIVVSESMHSHSF